VSKLRYLFIVKTCIMPIFGIVLFAWAVKAGMFSHQEYLLGSG
jgi:nitrogen fixation-related uncharacterized protein